MLLVTLCLNTHTRSHIDEPSTCKLEIENIYTTHIATLCHLAYRCFCLKPTKIKCICTHSLALPVSVGWIPTNWYFCACICILLPKDSLQRKEFLIYFVCVYYYCVWGCWLCDTHRNSATGKIRKGRYWDRFSLSLNLMMINQIE